jgi:hypothetical protein
MPHVAIRVAAIANSTSSTTRTRGCATEHHAERRRVDQARGLHARQVLDPIEHAARERMDALGLIGEAVGQRHVHGLRDAVAPARFEDTDVRRTKL